MNKQSLIDEKKYSIRDFRNFLRFFELSVNMGLYSPDIDSRYINGMRKGRKLMLDRLVDKLHKIDSIIKVVETS